MQDEVHKIESFIIPLLPERVRISDFYAAEYFQYVPSRKAMKKAIIAGYVKIDGKVARTADYVQGGEHLEVYEKRQQIKRKAIDIEIEVLWEDDYLAVVNKPAGIEVSGNKRWTLENAVVGKLKSSTQPDALDYAQAIHRLDYPTTGIVLFGKTQKAVIRLNQLFEEKQVAKIYYAITVDQMPASGEINEPIDNKAAHSTFEVVESLVSEKFNYLNLVKLQPSTGRRHQLRKHLLSIGNPIFGDADYTKPGFEHKGRGLHLHAQSIKFIHPFTQEEMEFTAPFSKKFVSLFEGLGE